MIGGSKGLALFILLILAFSMFAAGPAGYIFSETELVIRGYWVPRRAGASTSSLGFREQLRQAPRASFTGAQRYGWLDHIPPVRIPGLSNATGQWRLAGAGEETLSLHRKAIQDDISQQHIGRS